MRIRFKRSIAGPGWSGRKGKVVDLPDAEARGYLANGYADAVDEGLARPAPPAAASAPPTENERDTDPPTAATVSAPERAVQPRARGRST